MKHIRYNRVTKTLEFVFGYFVPSIIAGVCLYLAVFDHTSLDIQYWNKICFPSGYHGFMFIFVFLIMFSICLDILLLVLLANKVNLTVKNMTSMARENVTRDIRIVFSLTISFGVFWMFELVKGYLGPTFLRLYFCLSEWWRRSCCSRRISFYKADQEKDSVPCIKRLSFTNEVGDMASVSWNSCYYFV